MNKDKIDYIIYVYDITKDYGVENNCITDLIMALLESKGEK